MQIGATGGVQQARSLLRLLDDSRPCIGLLYVVNKTQLLRFGSIKNLATCQKLVSLLTAIAAGMKHPGRVAGYGEAGASGPMARARISTSQWARPVV